MNLLPQQWQDENFQRATIASISLDFKDMLRYTQDGYGCEIEEIAQRKRKKAGRPKREQKQNNILTRSQLSDKAKLQNFKDWYINTDEQVTFQKLLSKRDLPAYIKKMSDTPDMAKKMKNGIEYINRKKRKVDLNTQ